VPGWTFQGTARRHIPRPNPSGRARCERAGGLLRRITASSGHRGMSLRNSLSTQCERPTCCASAAAEARRIRRFQKTHDLARRRRSAASAGWAAVGRSLLVCFSYSHTLAPQQIGQVYTGNHSLSPPATDDGGIISQWSKYLRYGL
jgi:hypothetical protein